jgi:hypothetical protein
MYIGFKVLTCLALILASSTGWTSVVVNEDPLAKDYTYSGTTHSSGGGRSAATHQENTPYQTSGNHIGTIRLAESPKADGYFEEHSTDAVKEPVSTIIVKGLFIGMNIQDVPGVLRTKLDGNKVSIHDAAKGDAGRYPNALTRSENYYVAVGGLLPIGIVYAGPDGKVTDILFLERLVDIAFNAEKLDVSVFAQEFINAYNIPAMQLSDDRRSWYFISPDGVKVSIHHDKTLHMQRVSTAAERKNTFN